MPRKAFVVALLAVLLLMYMARSRLLLGSTTSQASSCQHPTRGVDNPFRNLYTHPLDQCQETIFQPFVVGCPSSCADFRPDATEDTPFYRVTLEWYFGQPPTHNQTIPEGSYYSHGRNYQSHSGDLAQSFAQASDRLEASIQEQFVNATVKLQKRMHLTLVYLCCLQEQEAHHVREILPDFVHRSFDIRGLSFDRIECWKEAHNSITTIIVVDPASQVRLLGVLHDLEKLLHAQGISLTVPRTQQMPFHVTLLGLRRGKQYSMKQEDSIDSWLDATATALRQLDWSPSCLDLQHRPKFSPKIEQHTQLG